MESLQLKLSNLFGSGSGPMIQGKQGETSSETMTNKTVNNLKTMLLHIGPDRVINDIQKEFNKMFPYLKIEFFNNRSFSPNKFAAKQLFNPERKIGESHRAVKNGTIEINDDMKVQDLENIFKDQFTLAVQVFRKSGTIWLETTMTDNWTLKKQNNHGKELSTTRPPVEKNEDFDLTRDND